MQIYDCNGWLYAVKPGKTGRKKIAFRAELDALPIAENPDDPHGSRHPGISHKCGHDGHLAALCGLALELEQEPLDQTICLIFQPGEEIGTGARVCLEQLREEGISEIYAFHNLPGYPAGSVVYRNGLTQPASEGIRFTWTGERSHAAEPEKGKTPASLIADLVLYSETVRKALRDRLLLSTVTGIRMGSGDFGISPGEGEVSITLRAEEEEEMKSLERELIRFTCEQAEQEGIRVEYSIHDPFPETRNQDACLQKVLQAAKRKGIPAIRMQDLWRASEDFGHYLKAWPGAIFYIGCGEHYPALHTKEYDFPDAILEQAVDLLLEIADADRTEQ